MQFKASCKGIYRLHVQGLAGWVLKYILNQSVYLLRIRLNSYLIALRKVTFCHQSGTFIFQILSTIVQRPSLL